MRKILFTLSTLTLLALPGVTFAQVNEWLNNMALQNILPTNVDLPGLVFSIIRYILGFLGVVAVVVIIIGGFMWMTAAGNEEKVAKAKKVLVQGLIGLVIVMLAFAIATFVMSMIRTSTAGA
ncbi:MAG: hypothetical protein N2259_03155 [Patescibacteria group bacterium]|nr:hypothetical protein [Patescibacteria group bacterium]